MEGEENIEVPSSEIPIDVVVQEIPAVLPVPSLDGSEEFDIHASQGSLPDSPVASIKGEYHENEGGNGDAPIGIDAEYIFADKDANLASNSAEGQINGAFSDNHSDGSEVDRPNRTTAGDNEENSKMKAVSASILEASIDDEQHEESLRFKDPGSPSFSPPPSPLLVNMDSKKKKESPKKNVTAMIKTSSQYGEYVEAAQPKRDIHLLQQQHRGFFNRRLQQNQLLVHSFPAGFSLQVSRRDVGACDFDIDTRPYAVRHRSTSPEQAPSAGTAVAPTLLFPSQLSKHPAAAETLAGPFVDLGVYGGPAVTPSNQQTRHHAQQHKPKHDIYVVTHSASEAGSSMLNMSHSVAPAVTNGNAKIPPLPAKKPVSATTKSEKSTTVKGTTAYSQALAKTRVSAITSAHTGSSYTSWMRGAAFEHSDQDDYYDENGDNDEDDEGSDPYADCAGPTLTMLRRLRQQQGVQLPTQTQQGGSSAWALTGQRLSLTIPTHTHPASNQQRRVSHDSHSVRSESLNSSAPSMFSYPQQAEQENEEKFIAENDKNHFQKVNQNHLQPSQQSSSPQKTSSSLPKIYHAPALMPAFVPSTLPTTVSSAALAAYNYYNMNNSSPPLTAQNAAAYYSANSSTSAPDTASQAVFGAVNAPHPQPLMPQSHSGPGVVDYATWIAHQRQERDAHDVWRTKGNDVDRNYSLYHGILYSGLSATSEKIAWLVEQGVEPGLQPQVLQDMLLRPEVALPDQVLLCLFSATQMLKALPNHQQTNANLRALSMLREEDMMTEGGQTVGVRPGTQVFGGSSTVSLAGEASITQYNLQQSQQQQQQQQQQPPRDFLSLPVQEGPEGIPPPSTLQHEMENMESGQQQMNKVDDTDAMSYHSHQSLQSLLSSGTDYIDQEEEERKEKRKKSLLEKPERGRRVRNGSVTLGSGSDVVVTVNDLVLTQQLQQVQQQFHTDGNNVANNAGSISVRMHGGSGVMTDSLSATAAVSSNREKPSLPMTGFTAAPSQWLTDGVQRLVPTQSSLRYVQEVIVHDIAEAILTAFPTYHHELLRHGTGVKSISAMEMQHQRQLARSVEEEYYRLAKNLATGMKLQVFDHRDHTWRVLRNEADWQRGVLNALLYPNHIHNSSQQQSQYQQQRVEIMYHLPVEVEAQLKRHLLLHRHAHRHEAQRWRSTLVLAQAAVSGVLNSIDATASNADKNNDPNSAANGTSRSNLDAVDGNEDGNMSPLALSPVSKPQQSSRERRAISAMANSKKSMSMSTTSIGSSASAILDEHTLLIQQHQQQQAHQESASRHLKDSLASLTAALTYQSNLKHKPTYQNMANAKQKAKVHHRLEPLSGMNPKHHNNNDSSVQSSALSSSNASLGSGFNTYGMTTGTMGNLSASNPLLLATTQHQTLKRSASLSADVNASSSLLQQPRASAARTPPLTVVKAPSLLYPQPQHYKVQAMKRQNDDALPKLQAMAESLEQRLLLTRWG